MTKTLITSQMRAASAALTRTNRKPIPKYGFVWARWHRDPAHGWLEVDYAALEALGIAQDISKYSYRYGNTVFLEEDCDAGIFFEAADNNFWDYEFSYVEYGDLAPLRSYPRYAPGWLHIAKPPAA